MKDLKRNTWTVLLLWKLNIFTDGPERVNCFRAQIFSFPCLTVSTRRFMCNEFPITDLHQLGCQSACLYSACLHLTMFSLHVEVHTKACNSYIPTNWSRWNAALDFPCYPSLRQALFSHHGVQENNSSHDFETSKSISKAEWHFLPRLFPLAVICRECRLWGKSGRDALGLGHKILLHWYMRSRYKD